MTFQRPCATKNASVSCLQSAPWMRLRTGSRSTESLKSWRDSCRRLSYDARQNDPKTPRNPGLSSPSRERTRRKPEYAEGLRARSGRVRDVSRGLLRCDRLVLAGTRPPRHPRLPRIPDEENAEQALDGASSELGPQLLSVSASQRAGRRQPRAGRHVAEAREVSPRL